MSKKIFCATSNQSVGATFLDWSVHYLNNRDRFFNVTMVKERIVNEIINPLIEYVQSST